LCSQLWPWPTRTQVSLDAADSLLRHTAGVPPVQLGLGTTWVGITGAVLGVGIHAQTLARINTAAAQAALPATFGAAAAAAVGLAPAPGAVAALAAAPPIVFQGDSPTWVLASNLNAAEQGNFPAAACGAQHPGDVAPKTRAYRFLAWPSDAD